jgi:hypothetical protein
MKTKGTKNKVFKPHGAKRYLTLNSILGMMRLILKMIGTIFILSFQN